MAIATAVTATAVTALAIRCNVRFVSSAGVIAPGCFGVFLVVIVSSPFLGRFWGGCPLGYITIAFPINQALLRHKGRKNTDLTALVAVPGGAKNRRKAKGFSGQA